jgi:hypothetical protein
MVYGAWCVVCGDTTLLFVVVECIALHCIW